MYLFGSRLAGPQKSKNKTTPKPTALNYQFPGIFSTLKWSPVLHSHPLLSSPVPMNSESTFCLYDLVILNFLCIWDHTNLTLYRTAKLFFQSDWTIVYSHQQFLPTLVCTVIACFNLRLLLLTQQWLSFFSGLQNSISLAGHNPLFPLPLPLSLPLSPSFLLSSFSGNWT